MKSTVPFKASVIALLFATTSFAQPSAQRGVPAETATPDKPPVPVEDAPIAMLVDISSGQVLHARNETRRFVPASVTKTMTAFVAFEQLEEGKIAPNTRLLMSDEAFEEWNGEGSTMYLETDTPVTIDQLLTGILTVSANDGSIVLAEGTAGSVEGWTDLMNEKARELEMTGSHFGTPNGFPDEGHTFTTAQDLVKLARAIVRRHPERFARYFGNKTFKWNDIEQYNHDPMIGRVDGADGFKTGYTREAGFNFLGTAQRRGQRLVLVLAGVERGNLRDRMARDYIEWGFSAFDRERLYENGAEVGTARVQGGSARSVALVTDRTVFANVPKGRNAQLSATIQYDGPIRAPIMAGERIGTLEVTVPGMEPARLPLLAKEDVAEAGFFGRIVNGIAGWFS